MKHTGHTKNTENIGLIEDLRTEFKSDVKKLSEETIVEAIKNGAKTFDEVSEKTGAGTGFCHASRCKETILKLIDENK